MRPGRDWPPPHVLEWRTKPDEHWVRHIIDDDGKFVAVERVLLAPPQLPKMR